MCLHTVLLSMCLHTVLLSVCRHTTVIVSVCACAGVLCMCNGGGGGVCGSGSQNDGCAVHVCSFLTDFIISLPANPFMRVWVRCEIAAKRRGRGWHCAGLMMGWIDQGNSTLCLVDPLLGFVCQSAWEGMWQCCGFCLRKQYLLFFTLLFAWALWRGRASRIDS